MGSAEELMQRLAVSKKIMDNFFCNLIILDYMLPNQNGYDFLKELRKKKNDIT